MAPVKLRILEKLNISYNACYVYCIIGCAAEILTISRFYQIK